MIGVMTLFPLIALALAAAPADVTVTVTTSGRDGAGNSTFREFELRPDGRARWVADSLGTGEGGCGPLGGEFETRVPAEKAKALGALAREVVRAQQPAGKPAAPVPESALEIRNRVFVDVAGDVSQAEVRKATPAWDKLLAAVAELRAEMDATRSVLFSVKGLTGGRVRVTFRSVGDGGVKLQLPAKAEEGFKVEGARVVYARAQASALAPQMLELGKDRPEVSVTLKVAPAARKGALLRFTNQVIQHHAPGDPLEGDRQPPLLQLCAPIR